MLFQQTDVNATSAAAAANGVYDPYSGGAPMGGASYV